jgi:hypothetical protein
MLNHGSFLPVLLDFSGGVRFMKTNSITTQHHFSMSLHDTIIKYGDGQEKIPDVFVV